MKTKRTVVGYFPILLTLTIKQDLLTKLGRSMQFKGQMYESKACLIYQELFVNLILTEKL